MRHADDDFIDAEIGRGFENGQHAGHHGVAALDAETLHAGIFQLHELLEAFDFQQRVEDGFFLPLRRRRISARALHAVLNPLALFGILDMHELHAVIAGIGFLQDGEDFGERAALQPQPAAEIDRPVVIRRREAIGGGVEIGMQFRALEAQRVEVGGEVAAHAVGADELLGADGVPRRRVEGFFVEHGGLGVGWLQRYRIGIDRADDLGRLHIPRGFLRCRVAQRLEEALPAGIDGFGVGEIALVQLFNEGGVRAVKERFFDIIQGHDRPI